MSAVVGVLDSIVGEHDVPARSRLTVIIGVEADRLRKRWAEGKPSHIEPDFAYQGCTAMSGIQNVELSAALAVQPTVGC